MKLYTLIITDGPRDEGPYPAICYSGKLPILTQYKHLVEFEKKSLEEWFPEGTYKIGEINV